MRRRAVLQRIEQEAELELRFLGPDLERVEHLALHIGAVDTHRAAAEFPTVEHHVVGLGNALTRVGVHVVLVAVFRRGERVVRGVPALAVLVVLEHRKVHHPQRCPNVVEQSMAAAEIAVADLHAQRADGVVDHLFLVGAEEQQITGLCAGALHDLRHRAVVQVLDDRALQTFAALGSVIDLDPRQPLGTVDLDELGVSVDLAAAHLAALGHAQRDHAATHGGRRRAEHLEVDIGHHVGELGELELDAQIGLVGAKAVHRLGVLHHRVFGQIDANGLLEDLADHALEHRPDFFLGEEAGLDVDLGEFGLAIGTQVFVAEALGDLVIAVEASHHQQLLEQLRALRQREEHALVDAARHQVVPCAFGRALGEHRRFDVDETVLVEKLAHLHGYAVAQDQVLLHHRPAQIKHAVRQAGGLGEVLVVDLERRRDAGVEHLEFEAQHFDLAAGQIGVLGACGARTHLADDLQAELVAHDLGGLEHVGAVGVAHDLNQALTVAQVNEDDATVVAAAVRPAHEGHGLAHQGLVDQTAICCSHRVAPETDRGLFAAGALNRADGVCALARRSAPPRPSRSRISRPRQRSWPAKSHRIAAPSGKSRKSGSAWWAHRC